MPLQEMLKQLKEKYGDKYGWCLLSAEDHEERENDSNVGVHRHAIVFAKSRFQTRDQRFWDLKYEDKVYHPHVEGVKSKKKCINYVCKDGDYIQDGEEGGIPFDVKIYLEASTKKSGYGFTYIANEIKKGKTLYELDDVIPGHVLNHKRKIEEYISFQEEKRERLTPKPKFPGFKVPSNYQWKLVADWANDNFLKPRVPRQPQLWLWSRQPEMGKSYPWSIIMKEYYNCYEWVYGPKQGKEVLTCDYVLIDELKPNITVTELKTISQMYGMNLDIKFGSVSQWKKNVPMIVTSNRPPREIFHKVGREDIESLESRFLIVEVDEQCHLQLKEQTQEQEVQSQEQSQGITPETEHLLLGTPDIEFENKQELSEQSEDSENSEPSEYEMMLRLAEKKDSAKKNSKNLKNSKK